MANDELVENIKLAFELQKKGQYAEAIATLYKLLAVESDNLEAIIQIAYLFYLRHDIDFSIEYYEKALCIQPDNIQALQGLFDVYKSEKNYDKALTLAKQIYSVEKNDTNFTQLLFILTLCEKYQYVLDQYKDKSLENNRNKYIYFYVAISFYYLNDIKSAKEYFTKVYEVDKRDIETLFYLSKINYLEKDYQKSSDFLDSLLSIKDDARALNLKGMIQLELQNNSKAVSFFTEAVKIDRINAEYIYNLGIAYSLNGWFEEAQKCFLSAIALDPESMDVHYALAYLYYEQKNYLKAKLELEFIFSKIKNYPKAKILEAVILAAEGNSVEAEEILKEFISQDPKNDFAYWAFGVVYENLGQPEKAMPYFEKAISINPSSVEYLYKLAEAAYKTQDYSTVLDNIKLILDINCNYVAAYSLKAKTLIKMGKYKAVDYVLEDMLSLDNSAHEAYKLKAEVFEAKEQFKDAIEAMKQAIILNPNNLDYYKDVANLYEKQGNHSAAFGFYEDLIKSIPPSSTVYLAFANCAENNKKLQIAQRYYFHAFAISPNSYNCIEQYFDFLVRQEKFVKALLFIQNVIDNGYCKEEMNTFIVMHNQLERNYLKTQPFFRKIVYKLFKI